jgi:Xaa-Pro dipeptidase
MRGLKMGDGQRKQVFDAPEYRRRMRRVKQRMYDRGIDILLVTDPANMNYLTGYDGWSFYVHQGVIVVIDREEPLWFGREQDSNGARLTTWLTQENIRPYTDDYVHSPTKHPMEFAADVITEVGVGKRYIGVEMDNCYFTGQALECLREGLPQWKFKDADLLVNWVRVIKSDAELRYMRMAARIVEKTMQAAIDAIAAGVREGDAAADVYHAQISGTADFTGDYSAIAPIMPSGIRTSTAHLTWTDRRYEPGDIVLLELAGCKNRYHAPLARTLVIGSASSALEDTARAVIEGLNTVIDFIEPEITGEEIEEKWREAVAGSAVVKMSRIGYSFGLNYPPDWGEHTISLRPGDKHLLKPGMTLHLMPGIWEKDFGFECSEPIRVTESGCEPLTDFPRKLFIK